MNAAALKCARIDGKRRDERLAFAGLHFGDTAFEENLAAHDLDVEVAHAEHALAGLADDRKRFGQQVIEQLACREAAAKLFGLRAKFVVGERFDLRFEYIDSFDGSAQP